ncbi:MAG: DNA-3-methyladenine glycosylase 2 family protein, partial [Betaproteobacteria bacterium]|nr:DNA-3-methyladenine glycosylase 2 family protein [Betaproteobacteria bacterium]
MGVAPGYWLKAKRRLAREDAVLAGIIRAHPRVSLVARGEPFFTLARSIVGQQISVKAAQSIWNRVAALAPEMQPAQVLALRARKRRLKAAGLSDRKVEYIVDLARHFHEGSIHPQRWGEMDDEAVIGELVQVRGIGRWTAEMFLMFNL